MTIDAAFIDAHRISPSQIETAQLCLRKWGLEKLDGLPKKSSKDADRGTAAHLVLEEWQRDGKPVDFSTDIGKIVSAGLKFLPQPKSHRVEHNFVFNTGKVVFHGKMDLRGNATFPIQTVWDHKTTGNFHWMKTPVVLRSDPQANIYATAAIDEAKKNGWSWEASELHRVEQNWIYYLANPDKPRSRKVQLHVVRDGVVRQPVCPEDVEPEHFGIMTRDELEENFGKLEVFSQGLVQLYHDKPKAMELPYNASACSAYGGCPYKDKPCKLTMSERIQSMEAYEENKKVSLAEKMAAREAEKKNTNGTAAPTAPASAPVSAPAAQPNPEKVAAAAAATPAASGLAAKFARPSMGQASPPATTDVPSVNPPEQNKGVDPDAPAGGEQTRIEAPAGTTHVASSFGRTEIATLAMQGMLASRGWAPSQNNRAIKEITEEAVQYADALLSALAK